MSNTRHVDLAKLAAVMRGQLPAGVRPVPPQIRERSRISFPRIPAERFEELLDDAEQDAITDAGQLRLRALLDQQRGGTLHYQGRPR